MVFQTQADEYQKQTKTDRPTAPNVHEKTDRQYPTKYTCYDKPNTTLRASLSGTFLQTLPQLVTPLKGQSLFPRI